MLGNLNLFKFFSFFLFIMSLFSFFLLLNLIYENKVLLFDWNLLTYMSISYVYSIIIDKVSLSFMMIVFLISSCVMFYSDEYMKHDLQKNSFSMVVFLFVTSMFLLIISPSLVSVILGWDGLGLVSYLLVIYYQNYKSYSAGMLTCLSNRIGDSAILVSMCWMLSLGSLDFLFYYNENGLEFKMIISFIILAAMTKSAQIPFSSWLPAAMAAPTPVSALVHSSTLVTAGVYLLIRFFPLINLSFMKNFLMISGLLTLLMSSLSALFEMDLKKIIALSTLSQLGLMMLSLSLGYYSIAYFHLLSHALFKASLFLCAGKIIHFNGGNQDIRYLNYIFPKYPLTVSCFMICTLSLMGFPFLSAFFSKDKIIEESLSMGNVGLFIYSILLISIMLTCMYSIRLIYYLNFTSKSFSYIFGKDNFVMIMPIIILTLGGIFGGFTMNWFIFDLSYDNEYLYIKFSILFMLLMGSIFGENFLIFLNKSFKMVYLYNMWLLPVLSTQFLSMTFINYSVVCNKYWDSGWNEKLVAKGLVINLQNLSFSMNKYNYISFKFFLFISFFFIFILLIYLL